jgi:fructose-1-phosphate kinase PfkB-like protein
MGQFAQALTGSTSTSVSATEFRRLAERAASLACCLVVAQTRDKLQRTLQQAAAVAKAADKCLRRATPSAPRTYAYGEML